MSKLIILYYFVYVLISVLDLVFLQFW